MKTILRFFYASAFVLTFVVGLTAVAGTRFALSFFVPGKTETTEQVVVAPASNDFPAEPSLVDTQPEIFDAGDIYYPPTKISKAFAEIQLIDIETREYWEEDGKYLNRPIVPTGYLDAGREFKFRSVTISDREITFETREINGISYRFVGHFPKNPEFEYCEGCEYPPDMKGKLTKLKNGKVIAETNAEFYVSGC